MVSKNRSRIVRLFLLLVGAAVFGCTDSADDGAAAGGALEALGEYVVTSNTCGEHWEGTYALSANRIAQFGQGTDQLFVEPTDPSSPANRGRGDLADGGNLSLQISFDLDGAFVVYDCTGARDIQAVLMECSAMGKPTCYLGFGAE
jgi:hypothetical protein